MESMIGPPNYISDRCLHQSIPLFDEIVLSLSGTGTGACFFSAPMYDNVNGHLASSSTSVYLYCHSYSWTNSNTSAFNFIAGVNFTSPLAADRAMACAVWQPTGSPQPAKSFRPDVDREKRRLDGLACKNDSPPFIFGIKWIVCPSINAPLRGVMCLRMPAKALKETDILFMGWHF